MKAIRIIAVLATLALAVLALVLPLLGSALCCGFMLGTGAVAVGLL